MALRFGPKLNSPRNSSRKGIHPLEKCTLYIIKKDYFLNEVLEKSVNLVIWGSGPSMNLWRKVWGVA